jgi:Bacterial PH domain
MSSDTHFDAPWSGRLKAMSWGTTLLLLALPLGAACVPRAPWWSVLFPCCATVSLVAGTALWTIRAYDVTPDALYIQRLFWQTEISLAGLRSAELIPEAAARSYRSCGNGGLFAFCGCYHNKKLGNFRMWATDLKRTVVLRFDDRTVVVSPDRPAEFIQQVRRKAGLE